MANKKKVGSSIELQEKVYIRSTSSIVGKKEGEGPLGDYYDLKIDDYYYGEDTWEKAESKFVKEAFSKALLKSNLKLDEIDYVITGDLLNQNIGSTFGIRDFHIPVLGIYGACSTMGESMSIGAMLIDGGYADNVLIGASSHFCTAERQFRTPLDLGGQRPASSTWTVTGDGSAVLSADGNDKVHPVIKRITTGKVVDLGIKDPFNMGGAMAPAAVDTIMRHLKDFELNADYYDLIVTGDLGQVGHTIVLNLLEAQGINIANNYNDCGLMIFDVENQKVGSGGSGCACSAVTFSGYLYDKLQKKEIKKLLFIPTGALLSTVSTQQGESIPGIAHAVGIEMID